MKKKKKRQALAGNNIEEPVLGAKEIENAVLVNNECSVDSLRNFFFDVHGYRVVGIQSVDRRYLISRTIQSLHRIWREQQKRGQTTLLDPDDEAKTLSIAYMLSHFKGKLSDNVSRKKRQHSPRKKANHLANLTVPLPKKMKVNGEPLKRRASGNRDKAPKLSLIHI